MKYVQIQSGLVSVVSYIPIDGFVEAKDEVFAGWHVLADGTFAPPQTTPGVTNVQGIVYKIDIWRRSTNAEAERIDAALNALPARLRMMWADSLYLDRNDELYQTIWNAFASAFGAPRATELLAPN